MLACLFKAEVLSKFHVARWEINTACLFIQAQLDQAHPGRSWRRGGGRKGARGEKVSARRGRRRWRTSPPRLPLLKIFVPKFLNHRTAAASVAAAAIFGCRPGARPTTLPAQWAPARPVLPFCPCRPVILSFCKVAAVVLLIHSVDRSHFRIYSRILFLRRVKLRQGRG